LSALRRRATESLGIRPVWGRPDAAPAAAQGAVSSRGFSLLELLLVVLFFGTVAAVAIPVTAAAIDSSRALGASRYVAARFQLARMQASLWSASVAVRFTTTGGAVSYAVFVDGNGDGVRARDIEDGIDRQISPDERLPDEFAGVDFGVLPGLPAVDAGTTAPGSDPLKLGSSDMVSFSSTGTSSSGSVYIRSRGDAQYVVRVFGETGRTRILKFNTRSNTWMPL
jgi:type II secretory pathway pseudopilin PulG